MSENSVIYMAAKNVEWGAGALHLYLVYDEDGSLATTNDQFIIRGGPQPERDTVHGTLIENTVNRVLNIMDASVGLTGNIELEIDSALEDSLDDLGSGETTTTRNCTALSLPINPLTEETYTADDFWTKLIAEANSMKNGDPDSDDDGRHLTDARYTFAGADVTSGNPAGLNSNSVITSLLAEAGVDVYAHLPQQGGTPLSATLFPQLQNIIVAGSDDDKIKIDDVRVRSVTDIGSGYTAIVIDGSKLDGGANAISTLRLTADSEPASMSDDEIELNNVGAADVKIGRTPAGDLMIYLPDDELPSIRLDAQFAGRRFDQIKIDGVWYSLTDSSKFPVGGLVRPDGSGGFIRFETGAYQDVETWTTTSTHTVTWNTASLFTVDLAEAKVTFVDGYEIEDIDVTDVALTVPDVETTKEAILDYLDQLGVEMTEAEFDEEHYAYMYPETAPQNADGTLWSWDGQTAYYRLYSSAGNTTVGGPTQVTVQVGVDGLGNPVYGQVTPINILDADENISRDTITNVQVLDVFMNTRLTEDQFSQFDLFTGNSGGIGDVFALTAATGGTFDASLINVDPGTELMSLTATDWSGTTLIGNDQDGQTLTASKFGTDTLEAGTGEDVTLVAGQGRNTLIGGAAGGTTFVAGGFMSPTGLAPGSTVTGSSTGNVLQVNGDISGAAIGGVQTLDVESTVGLTATQFGAFSTIEGSGILYAKTGGTYNWSGSDVYFSTVYAQSSDGTTLIANNADGLVTLYASENGNDELVAPTTDEARILDASHSTGDVILTVGDGDENIVYAGSGENTITLGTGDDNQVIANHGLAAGSSIVSNNNTTSQLLANGDISGATISGIYSLKSETGVLLSATQLAGFNALWNSDDMIIMASAAGTYSLSGKTLIGPGGTFTLIGSTGADTLTGSALGDMIYGDAGADTIDGGAGDDILAGGDGNDTINGGDGADSIDGGAGADTIRGGTGADVIYGGAGNDIIQIFSGEVPSGEVIDGGDGTDRLVVGSNSMGPLATITNMEELYLNSGVTSIALTAAQLDDFDTITHQDGGSQAFSITAQAAGSYSLAGKTITGILTLIGSSGADTLTGTSGNDILRGGQGADTIQAGDGNDNIIIASGEVASGDSIDGGNGTDRLTVGNNSMNPSAMAVANMEELYLNSGVTAITLSASQLADFETITQATSAAFSITAAAAGTYSLAGKTITGAATLNGTSGADTLTGSGNADTINGNAGNDLIEGGAGNDTLNGGNDTDTLTYANAGSAVTVDLSNGSAQNTGGAGTDTISNFENLTGSAYNDTLTGTSGNNVILGGDGNDTITGGSGADTIDGGIGTNTLGGGTGDDTYILERTYGASEITDNDSTGGNSDTLQLGDDIAADQMWFRQSGNDLLVEVIGTGAQMTIKDWYSGSDYQVEEIKTAGGADTLDHTAVQNLVSAMSSFSVPTTTTLPTEYHTALDSVIAANWT